MKLTCNPTTEANPGLRGRTHYFIIKNESNTQLCLYNSGL